MSGILEGKTIIITGGSTGIGRATSIRAAEQGAAVVIADINKEEAQKTCDTIKAASGNVMFVETDVTDSAAIKQHRAPATGNQSYLSGRVTTQ